MVGKKAILTRIDSRNSASTVTKLIYNTRAFQRNRIESLLSLLLVFIFRSFVSSALWEPPSLNLLQELHHPHSETLMLSKGTAEVFSEAGPCCITLMLSEVVISWTGLKDA